MGREKEGNLREVKEGLRRGRTEEEKEAFKKIEEAEKKDGRGGKAKGVGDDMSW